MSEEVQSPFQVFTDGDGSLLEGGYVYVGAQNLNPITDPITVYWDEALTTPAAQPIRTIGGLPVRNGTPAKIFIGALRYSILVQDKNQVTVYSSLDNVSPSGGLEARLADEVDPNNGASMIGYDGTTVDIYLRNVRVSPEKYGAVGDGIVDDSAALALWAASPFKYKMLLNKTYRCTSALTFTSDIDLFCEPGAHIQLEGTAKLTFQGVLTTLAGSLSVTPFKYDTSISVTSVVGLSNDDVLVIWNPTDSSFSKHRTYYYDGEFNEVLTASGTTVNLKRALRSTYPIGNSIALYRLDGISVNIANLKVTGPETQADLVRFELCRRVRWKNLTVIGGRDAAVRLDRSYDVIDEGGSVLRCNAPDTGLQYGIFVGNSQQVVINDAVLHGTRHGFTSGGQASPGSVPCRDVLVNRCVMSSDVSHSADFHGNTENAEFRDCIAMRGMAVGGENIRWIGGTIYREDDRPVLFTEVVGGLYQVKDLTVKHEVGVSFAGVNNSAIMDLVEKDMRWEFENIEHIGHATCEGAVVVGSWQPPGFVWSVRLDNIRMSGFTPLRVLTAIRGTRPDLQVVPTARKFEINDIDPAGAVSGFEWCTLVGTWTGAATRFDLPEITVKGDVSILNGEFLSATGTTFNYPQYPATPSLHISAPGAVFANTIAAFPQITDSNAASCVAKLHTANSAQPAGANQTRAVTIRVSMHNYQALA